VISRIPENGRFKKLDASSGKQSNTIQGGLAATMIDIASGPAIRSTLDAPLDYYISMVNSAISYIQPTIGDIVVRSDCHSPGRQ